MVIIRSLLVALTVLTSTNAVFAREGPVGRGEGTISCGRWISDRKNHSFPGFEATDVAWLLGFISAFNLYLLKADDDVARGTDTAALTAWVDSYCAAHPLDSLESAAASPVMELQKRSGAH